MIFKNDKDKKTFWISIFMVKIRVDNWGPEVSLDIQKDIFHNCHMSYVICVK